MTSKEIVKKTVEVLNAKKAEDITVLDIQNTTSLGDYFVIASAGNTTLVKTLAEEVEDKLSAKGIEPRKIEGASSSMWILMDYGDIIIHIFYSETREFYCLERLWGDAPKLDVSELLK